MSETLFTEPQALVVAGNTLLTEQMDGNIIKAIASHANVLKGRSLSMDMMHRTLRNAVLKNPYIAEDYRALLEALTHCCRVGLVPDGKEAALIPYKNNKTGKFQAQFVPMVYGILKQVRKALPGVAIYAECVYREDDFDHELGTNPVLHHKANLDHARVGAKGDENPIIAVYAVARYADNPHPEVVLLTRKDIEYYRDFSKDTRKNNIWSTHYAAMAEKTALRQLLKRMPMADENVGDIFAHDAEDEDFDDSVDVIEGAATVVKDDAPEPEATETAEAKPPAKTTKAKAAPKKAKQEPPKQETETEDESVGEDEDYYDDDAPEPEATETAEAKPEDRASAASDEDFEDDIPF